MRYVGECRHCGTQLPNEAELCSACNRLWCGHCGCVTNHTTRQHEEAIGPWCVDCGERIQTDDEEARLCASCKQDEGEYLSEQASYYMPDEGGENG